MIIFFNSSKAKNSKTKTRSFMDAMKRCFQKFKPKNKGAAPSVRLQDPLQRAKIKVAVSPLL